MPWHSFTDLAEEQRARALLRFRFHGLPPSEHHRREWLVNDSGTLIGPRRRVYTYRNDDDPPRIAR